jgi:hypothetical protein
MKKINLIVIFILLSVSCNRKKNNSEVSRKGLLDIKELLIYYKNAPLKAKAVTFLLENAKGLASYDSTGSFKEDNELIDNKFIINNINEAFSSSQKLLDAHTISQNDFFEYVLPYRVNYSHLHPWRQMVKKEYHRNQISSSVDIRVVIDSLNAINGRMCKWFSYGEFKGIEDTASYGYLSKKRKGDCVSMTNVANYTFRALGLPVTTDYVLSWGNINSSHAWNVLLLPSKQLGFMGAEDTILRYNPFTLFECPENEKLSTFKRPAKVYRRTFSIQKGSIAYRYRNTDLLPTALKNYRSIDVSDRYFPTMSFYVPDGISQAQKEPLLFICNYNSGEWVPVEAAEKKAEKFIFYNLADKLLYCIASIGPDGLTLKSSPFYLKKSGPIFLNPELSIKQNITLNRVQPVENDQMHIFATGSDFRNKKSKSYSDLMNLALGRTKSTPENTKYSLFIWEKGWKYLTSSTATNGKLSFAGVPSNSLFILSKNKSGPDMQDRPFICQNHDIIWL